MMNDPEPMRRWANIVAFHLALASFAISFTALWGYILNMAGLSQWGSGVEMALNTSLAITCLSLALLMSLLGRRTG